MTCPIESLYTDAHETTSLQYATKIKSLPKHPTHHAVFDNQYRMLFHATPNAIRTFGLRIQQILYLHIDFTGILERSSYFVYHLVFDIVHLSKMV